MNKNSIFFLSATIVFSCVFIANSQYEIAIKDFINIVPNDYKYVNMDKLKIKRINRTHPHFLING